MQSLISKPEPLLLVLCTQLVAFAGSYEAKVSPLTHTLCCASSALLQLVTPWIEMATVQWVPPLPEGLTSPLSWHRWMPLDC